MAALAAAAHAGDQFPSVAKPMSDAVTGGAATGIDKSSFRIMLENDVFFGHDKDYTNGTRLDYVGDISENRKYGISLTQLIFTPQQHANYPLVGQHPYAGYLAAGVGYIMTGEENSTTFEFQLGTTGKPSIARECQWLIHKVGTMDSWDGWGYQLPSEVTMQLSVRQDRRLRSLESRSSTGFQTDGLMYGRAEAGTVSVRAGIGFIFRFGYNLPPSMNDYTINGANYGVSPFLDRTYDREANSYYGIVGFYGQYVVHDLFIDGTVFHHVDTHVSKIPWQGEVYAGVGVRHRDVDYFFGAIYKSNQYRTQRGYTLLGNVQVKWNF